MRISPPVPSYNGLNRTDNTAQYLRPKFGHPPISYCDDNGRKDNTSEYMRLQRPIRRPAEGPRNS